MLKDTLSKFFKVDTLLSNLTGYVETRVELLKIEVKEDLSKGLAQAISYLFIAFILAVFVIFVSIALALLLGERFGNAAGFSIIAFVYLVLGVILWYKRGKMIAGLEIKLSILLKKKK